MPNQFDEIREEFGVVIPEYYIEFLHNYPAVLENTVSDPLNGSTLSDEELPKELEHVISMNREVRDPEAQSVWIFENGDFKAWPNNYWIIGHAAGDYYCIDTMSPYRHVYRSNHERFTIDLWADDVDQFVCKLVAETQADLRNFL